MNAVFPDRWQMPRLRARAAGIGFHQRALILAAAVSLAFGVATRYCQVAAWSADGVKVAHSQSPEAKRQHLLNDGHHWSAPAAALVLFRPAPVAFGISPVAPASPRRYGEDCLYSRPPPLC